MLQRQYGLSNLSSSIWIKQCGEKETNQNSCKEGKELVNMVRYRRDQVVEPPQQQQQCNNRAEQHFAFFFFPLSLSLQLAKLTETRLTNPP